jgi:hypothetical protein
MKRDGHVGLYLLVWPFDEALAPTPETPFQAAPQTYVPPSPVMHATAERELDAADPWAGITGVQGGALDPAALEAAVGHYADYGSIDPFRPMYESIDDVDVRKRNGQFRVAEGYDTSGGTEMDLAKSIDLSSAEDRLKFLDTFTQQSGGDPNAANMCGPTSVLGGAILAGGTDGVGVLLDAVDKLAPGADPEKVKELRAKLDPNNPQPLTGQDLADAQKYLYERLNAYEGLDVNDPEAMAGADFSTKGVDTLTLKKLLNADSRLAEMFKKNRMEISEIDTTSENGMLGDHAVLRMNDESGNPLLVYDPYARHKGQITGRIDGWSGEDSIKIDNGLADYEYARRGGMRP